MFKIGDLLADAYRVEGILSDPRISSMADVYLLRAQANKALMAGKTFRDEIFEADHRGARRIFLREAVTWFELGYHPNVLPAAILDVIGDRPMILTEYCPEGDLSSHIARGMFKKKLKLVVTSGMQICDGMIHAVAKGVRAHRDIKPTNLFYKKGAVRIADFGLSKSMVSGMSPGNFAGSGVSSVGIGTPTHLAPELWDDPTAFSQASDIYAIGLVLAEMFTGIFPIHGADREQLKSAHQSIAPDLALVSHSGLKSTIRSCLEKSPAQRIGSFVELRSALETLYRESVGVDAPRALTSTDRFGTIWLYNQGVYLARLGESQRGIALVSQAIDDRWPLPQYLLTRAGIHENEEHLDLALKDCQQALACVGIQPGRWSEPVWGLYAFANIIDLLIQLSRLEEAAERAKEMHSSYGAVPLYQFAVTKLLIEQNRLEEALRSVKAGVARLGYETCGTLLMRLIAQIPLDSHHNNLSSAAEATWSLWLDTKASLDPDFFWGIRTLQSRGHWQLARTGLLRMDGIFSGHKKILRLLSSVSKNLGRDTEALEYEEDAKHGVFC